MIGTIDVAWLSAIVHVLPALTITAGSNATRSVTNSGAREISPSAHHDIDVHAVFVTVLS